MSPQTSKPTLAHPLQSLRALLGRVPYPELTPLWIAVFIDVLGYSILIPFLPFFTQEFNAAAWQVGMLLSANALFGFFSGPIWGNLSDKYGRKPILLICQFGTLAGFVMLALSRNMTMLFLSRIVDGIFGGNFPIAKAIVGDVVSPKDRSKQLSNVGVAHVLSSLLGPGLGGLLSRWGIVAPALLASALTCITISVTWLFLRESNPASARASAKTQPEAKTAAQPSQPRESLWHNQAARRLLLQWAFHTLSFSLYIACISLFASIKLGLTAEQTGILLTIAGVVRVIVRFTVFVPMLNRLGERATARLGLGIFVVTYIALGFVVNQWQFAAVVCVVSFAASCTRGVLTSFLSSVVPPHQRGQAMGASASLDNLAQIIGPSVGGAVLGAMPVWVYGGLAGVVALVAFVMDFRLARAKVAQAEA